MLAIPEQIGLYIHLPWCVKKCPYCDFNSHQLRTDLDEQTYIKALISDFKFDINRLNQPRTISSIFIGGGTPSLFSAKSIQQLLAEVKQHAQWAKDIEITLEANPGAVDESRFGGYRQAGVNRLSIGVQSFSDHHLESLGRIHGSDQAVSAVTIARAAGFDNFNIDLMYCLPNQTVDQANNDVEQAIALAPTHISAYHLTIEPNTLFAQQPPKLPDEKTAWQIQQHYVSVLEKNGYRKYEISAYARQGSESRHNVNYWRFGDYLGIGAGAHGKLTTVDGIVRTTKPKHPERYKKAFNTNLVGRNDYLKKVDALDLPLEYMMNKLRLLEPLSLSQFQAATGLSYDAIAEPIERALQLGLVDEDNTSYALTEKGRLFLDDLLQLFLPNEKDSKQCCG